MQNDIITLLINSIVIVMTLSLPNTMTDKLSYLNISIVKQPIYNFLNVCISHTFESKA